MSEKARWVGRVALVTGASAGIGEATAKLLVQEGMKVVICARSIDKLQAIAEDLNKGKTDRCCLPVKCDVSKEDQVLEMFKQIRSELGRLDICINNAGINVKNCSLLEGSTETWQKIIDVNVIGLSICTREAVKLMREKGIDDGHIIHLSSFSGHRVPPGNAVTNFYAGTKFAVRALTEGLRQELRAIKSNIRVSITTSCGQLLKYEAISEGRVYSLTPSEVAEAGLALPTVAPPTVVLHNTSKENTPTAQRKSRASGKENGAKRKKALKQGGSKKQKTSENGDNASSQQMKSGQNKGNHEGETSRKPLKAADTKQAPTQGGSTKQKTSEKGEKASSQQRKSSQNKENHEGETSRKPLNVAVTKQSLSPGLVKTDFNADVIEGDYEAFISSRPTMSSEDVARLVLVCIQQPAHVQIHDILVRPTQQLY